MVDHLSGGAGSEEPRRRGRGIHSRCVHASGEDSDETSIAPPIYQTATFRLRNAEEGAEFSVAHHPEKFYTRWGNPTTQRLEAAVAELEGGQGALATASGMGAITTGVMSCVAKGDHIVAGKTLYTATTELFARVLPSYGVTCTLVDPRDPGAFAQAMREETKLVYLETPANPTLGMTDLAAVCDAVKRDGLEIMADNTFASPINQNPLAFGVTIVAHSSTKYIGGHSDVTGGILVGSREFLGRAWYTLKVNGAIPGPFDAWLLLRGLKTMALRVHRQNESALALARFLEGCSAVSCVHYPGLESHPDHGIAKRQMKGYGGILSFECAAGFEGAKRFVESVRLATLAVSLGGVETLVEHPASMTHGPLSEEERRVAGFDDGLVRVSVGIEDVEDLQEDFHRALEG